MRVTTLGSKGDVANFSLNGICLHCRSKVSLLPYLPAHDEEIRDTVDVNRVVGTRFAAIAKCPDCTAFVLAVVTRKVNQTQPGQPSREPFVYEAHFPIGTPDDSIGDGIPDDNGHDFKEALRCQWIKSYKASVCMCRRALEASCIDLGADGKDLREKINSVATKGTISKVLKDLAQRIRLTGNRGAHAPKNQEQKDEAVTPEHVEALIAFTRQFFQHVYVMPFELNKFADSPNEGKL